MRYVLLVIFSLAATACTEAAYVSPQIGGGSVGMEGAPMKHLDVWFDEFGTGAIEVTLDESVAAPRLRPLVAPDEFDPAKPESVLSGKAYNRQFGWRPVGVFQAPTGAALWIEALGTSTGLEVYQAAPEDPAFAPIFGTDGSSSRWKWSTLRMTHNYYAAEDFTSGRHWAEYRVYLGDESTGEPLVGYGAAEVRFEFALPGNFNADGLVDGADRQLWASSFGLFGANLPADGNGDGLVDAADYAVWRDHVTNRATAIPEPAAWLLVAVGVVGRRGRR